jgi:ubiquinone/menaquinone biosynthesis C-methylase UbiE
MKKILCGNEMDRMPNFAFRMMSAMFTIQDWLRPVGAAVDAFNIRPGDVVVDYGCGPGRHVKRASELVGETGVVYAVDIHELAKEAVERLAEKHALANVRPMVTNGASIDIPGGTADIIYALDMFHMVGNPDQFLKELCRILKPNGVLYLEDGHQSRAQSKEKVLKSGVWRVEAETSKHLVCKPVLMNHA